jgi:hypothetical protein
MDEQVSHLQQQVLPREQQRALQVLALQAPSRATAQGKEVQ